MQVEVLYFASLRDAAGCASELVETSSADIAALYAEVRARHKFAFAPDRLRAAIDGAFVAWDAPLHNGAEVAFLPPVSGG
jgi:molybdopterin synthase sulfur carrier subunit